MKDYNKKPTQKTKFYFFRFYGAYFLICCLFFLFFAFIINPTKYFVNLDVIPLLVIILLLCGLPAFLPSTIGSIKFEKNKKLNTKFQKILFSSFFIFYLFGLFYAVVGFNPSSFLDVDYYNNLRVECKEKNNDDVDLNSCLKIVEKMEEKKSFIPNIRYGLSGCPTGYITVSTSVMCWGSCFLHKQCL